MQILKSFGIDVAQGGKALSNRRFIRRSIIPILARTLKPLKPSKEELEAALSDLTKLRHKIGRKLSSRDLLTALA